MRFYNLIHLFSLVIILNLPHFNAQASAPDQKNRQEYALVRMTGIINESGETVVALGIVSKIPIPLKNNNAHKNSAYFFYSVHAQNEISKYRDDNGWFGGDTARWRTYDDLDILKEWCDNLDLTDNGEIKEVITWLTKNLPKEDPTSFDLSDLDKNLRTICVDFQENQYESLETIAEDIHEIFSTSLMFSVLKSNHDQILRHVVNYDKLKSEFESERTAHDLKIKGVKALNEENGTSTKAKQTSPPFFTFSLYYLFAAFLIAIGIGIGLWSFRWHDPLVKKFNNLLSRKKVNMEQINAPVFLWDLIDKYRPECHEITARSKKNSPTPGNALLLKIFNDLEKLKEGGGISHLLTAQVDFHTKNARHDSNSRQTILDDPDDLIGGIIKKFQSEYVKIKKHGASKSLISFYEKLDHIYNEKQLSKWLYAEVERLSRSDSGQGLDDEVKLADKSPNHMVTEEPIIYSTPTSALSDSEKLDQILSKLNIASAFDQLLSTLSMRLGFEQLINTAYQEEALDYALKSITEQLDQIFSIKSLLLQYNCSDINIFIDEIKKLFELFQINLETNNFKIYHEKLDEIFSIINGIENQDENKTQDGIISVKLDNMKTVLEKLKNTAGELQEFLNKYSYEKLTNLDEQLWKLNIALQRHFGTNDVNSVMHEMESLERSIQKMVDTPSKDLSRKPPPTMNHQNEYHLPIPALFAMLHEQFETLTSNEEYCHEIQSKLDKVYPERVKNEDLNLLSTLISSHEQYQRLVNRSTEWFQTSASNKCDLEDMLAEHFEELNKLGQSYLGTPTDETPLILRFQKVLEERVYLLTQSEHLNKIVSALKMSEHDPKSLISGVNILVAHLDMIYDLTLGSYPKPSNYLETIKEAFETINKSKASAIACLNLRESAEQKFELFKLITKMVTLFNVNNDLSQTLLNLAGYPDSDLTLEASNIGFLARIQSENESSIMPLRLGLASALALLRGAGNSTIRKDVADALFLTDVCQGLEDLLARISNVDPAKLNVNPAKLWSAVIRPGFGAGGLVQLFRGELILAEYFKDNQEVTGLTQAFHLAGQVLRVFIHFCNAEVTLVPLLSKKPADETLHAFTAPLSLRRLPEVRQIVLGKLERKELEFVVDIERFQINVNNKSVNPAKVLLVNPSEWE